MKKINFVSLAVLCIAFTLTTSCGEKPEEKKLALKNEIQTLEKKMTTGDTNKLSSRTELKELVKKAKKIDSLKKELNSVK